MHPEVASLRAQGFQKQKHSGSRLTRATACALPGCASVETGSLTSGGLRILVADLRDIQRRQIPSLHSIINIDN
jgi:hypothetical protein